MSKRKLDRSPSDERTDRREREKLPEPPPFDPDMTLIGDMEKPKRPIQRGTKRASRGERERLPEPPPFDPDMSLIGDMEKLQRPLRRDEDQNRPR